MLDRSTIVEALAHGLVTREDCRAATLGGSDATGRADDLSDVDLVVFVTPGAIEAVAAAIEETLRGLSAISAKYRMPMPNWHGFHQAFYQLADAPEHLMVDWVMIEVGSKHPWFEVERHGTHRVLFDKDGVVQVEHVDEAALAKQIAAKIEDVRVKFRLFRHLPGKLARRELPADAMYFYQSLALRPLVDMLRIVHCPHRFDFGFRYVKDDLPRGAYERLLGLCYPAGVEVIEGNVREISLWIEELAAEAKRLSRGV